MFLSINRLLDQPVRKHGIVVVSAMNDQIHQFLGRQHLLPLAPVQRFNGVPATDGAIIFVTTNEIHSALLYITWTFGLIPGTQALGKMKCSSADVANEHILAAQLRAPS